MARAFDVNNQRLAGYYAGFAMFALKEMAVSIGWTVVGSGDGDGRFAYSGETSALPGNQQGSGGDYDCWMTGATRTDSTPGVAGDAGNEAAWVVLANGARQVLLQHTDQNGAANYNGYARMAYNPGTGATPAFDGSAADTSTIPDPATNEVWMIGNRATPAGDVWLPWNTAGYVHIWGDDAAGAGGAFTLGLVFVESSGTTVARYFCFAAVTSGTELSGDSDPSVAYLGTTAPTSTSAPAGFAWNELTSAMEAVADDALGLPWRGQGNSVGGDDQLTQLYAVCTASSGTRYCKGLVTTSGFASSPTQRGWGDRGEDGDGLGWVHLGNNGGLLMPWPGAATVPFP